MTLRLRNGVYHMDLTYTNPETGERVRIRQTTGTGDQRLAKAKHAQVEAALFRGDYVPPEAASGIPNAGRVLSVGRAIDRWIEVYLASASALTTKAAADAARALDKAGPITLAEPIAGVTSARLREALADWSRAGLSPATQAQRMWVLRGALKAAVDMHAIPAIPDVPRPAKPRTSKAQRLSSKVFSHADEARVLQALAARPDLGDLLDFLVVALDTGCRLSEVIGIRITDVDRINGRRLVVTGKGDKVRTVPLTERALATIRRRCAADPDGLMFRRPKGRAGRYWQTRLEDLWSAFRGTVGLPHLTLHSTRHTFGSRLVAAGANVRAVQGIMGHESITTTEVYLSMLDDAPEQMADLLERFNEARGGNPRATVSVVASNGGTP